MLDNGVWGPLYRVEQNGGFAAKEECLAKLIPFGEGSLRRALSEFVEHYHAERNHQGRENLLLFPRGPSGDSSGGEPLLEWIWLLEVGS
jgi:hypothetical protein